MIHQRAEDCFREGKELLESGNAAGALSQFKAAIDIERSRGVTDEGQARYLSYYGLCLALSRCRFAEAVHYCQQATRRESYRALDWWNLGRVNYAFGRRRAAWRAWQKGLEVEPGHVVATDVPALWLLRKKNAIFYTGLGRGDFARLMMASSLLTLRNVDEVRAIEHEFVDVLQWILQLEPPRWPGTIDQELAAAGREVFTERCTPCHGSYGAAESYPNLLVRLEKIGTDPLLAEEQFTLYAAAIEAFNESWFAQGPHAARLVPERGYVAPPLDGVWATAPYLHNGSVPTLAELLDSRRRPAFWKRRRRTPDYDFERVGVRYRKRKWAANPSVHDTTLPGYGNQGHTFGDALDDARRRAVIEYLKTL
jgi:tetratricopeptide (TPR) repeat protein